MRLLLSCMIIIISFSVQASAKKIVIYHDTDISRHPESSQAIRLGIEVAFAEINNSIAGYQVHLKSLDHRGNVLRSKQHFQDYINDPQAIALFSGIHSPPLIKNRDFINNNKALTLVPWAAGAPITRHPSPQNWIFRLSIDDTYAGSAIIEYAVQQKKCTHPHLVVEDTPWGHLNLKSMSKALSEQGLKTPAVSRFGWNISQQGAQTLINNILEQGNDCLILVANAVEGAIIGKALTAIPKKEQIPIISHWGITGGNFHQQIPHSQRKKIDLTFIQSCFAFTHQQQSDLARQVLQQLKRQTKGKIAQPEDLKSAVGFIHAYDLSKLLITAIKQAGLSGDKTRDQNAIRLALENLKTPTHGLIKTYTSPFAAFDPETNPDAHEALDKDQYCMGQYGPLDEVLIVQ